MALEFLEKLSNRIWEGDASKPFLREWGDLAEELTFKQGEQIVRQFHPARYLYFLFEGEIEHSLHFSGSLGDAAVGGISLRFFPLGWSGFSAPFRYATSASASSECTLYRWAIDDLNQLFYAYPAMGEQFFRHLFDTLLPLLDDARHKLKAVNSSADKILHKLARKIAPVRSTQPDYEERLELISSSLFMEVFPERFLELLVEKAGVEHFSQGEVLYRQGGPSEKLLLLATGSVLMSCDSGDNGEIFLRTYSLPGQVVATTVFSLSGRHEETATALTDVSLLSIKKSDITALCQSYPEFGQVFAKRLLWLLSARLRTMRIQLVAQQWDEEHVVVQNLLSQVSPQLGVSSKLYKLPHLLACRLTHAEALACLQEVRQSGTPLERSLASVCLDLLAELWRELEFDEGLQAVYQAVTQSPLFVPEEEVRRRCNQEFKKVFEKARHVIRGLENLPPQPGHIFILNHLISHRHHALANGFEFALDTHFVSSMILEPFYGDGGVRMVRHCRGEEYGHQSYYERLGHIHVYTAESEAQLESEEEAAARRAGYIETAANYLDSGTNLIICPEGTSNRGEDSPSEFKKGTFHLAASLKLEPLIVPIAVAGFDKRLKNNAFAAVVHKPFYLKDKCDPSDKQSLENFLAEFRETYRGYVIEAQLLANAFMRQEGKSREQAGKQFATSARASA
jgi:CRP-like cAMP-binding protein